MPHIAVTLGDPGGIGPEVVAKALADATLRDSARWVVLGPRGPLEAAAAKAGVSPWWTPAVPGAPWSIGPRPVLLDSGVQGPFSASNSALNGEVSFRCVSDAIDLSQLPPDHPHHVAAVVTAPISKQAWALAGHGEFPGHTEFFAARFGVERFAMFFHAPPAAEGPGLNVILATVHIPLMRVREHLSVRRVIDTIQLGHEALMRLGVPRPTIAVCGLNPHAGEEGLLGTDDREVIEPAVREAAAMGINVRGPFPADTVFQRALSRVGRPAQFDLVVAMYHDQGLIPLKTLAWDRAVNMTVGLPIARTSPDHGTAFDISGKNLADAGSTKAAMALAVRAAAQCSTR